MDLARGDLLLLSEAAELVNVPVESLRHWVKRGRLPSYKPGRRLMVLRSDLIDLVLRSRSGGDCAGASLDSGARPTESTAVVERREGDRALGQPVERADGVGADE